MDFEGISFRCRRCFKICHNVDSCDRCKVERPTSWWKEIDSYFYMVEKVEVNHISSQDLGGLIKYSKERVPEADNSDHV